MTADLEAQDGPWRSGEQFVVGRPRARHTIEPGIQAIGVRGLLQAEDRRTNG